MVEGRTSLLTHEEREFVMAHASYELEAAKVWGETYERAGGSLKDEV